MAVQAKFFVAEVTRRGYGLGSTDADGKPITLAPTRKVILRAVSRKDEQNRKFWSATPSGSLEMELSAKDGDAAGVWFEDRIGTAVILTFDDAPAED